MQNVPSYIQEKLHHQEKILKQTNRNKKKFMKLSQYMAKKLNKDPEELITGNNENYRIRKEILELIDYQKPTFANYREHAW